MKCEQCREREATIQLTHVVEGEARTMGLCEQCAGEKGIQTPAAITESPLGGFLSALWKGAGPSVEGSIPEGTCPGCGATFADFRETGRLGCAQCWLTFEAPLRILIRRYHGSTFHLGRRHAVPGEPPPQASDQLASDLREQLRVAVESENFELAAELRDRLKELP